MKTAAVVIDKWKLAIFTKHLQAAGYKFETLKGITEGSLTLKVEDEWVAERQPVEQAANNECKIHQGQKDTP